MAMLCIMRTFGDTEVNSKVNAPVNGMFRVAFTFQRAENRIKYGDPQR